jgi:uncharacterized protein (TIGR00251 family)
MWYRFDDNDLILHLRIQPKASSDTFAEELGDERKLRITAPPVDGKANKHIIAVLSNMFKVPNGDIVIESGELGRHKRIRIRSPKRLPGEIVKSEK